MAQVERLLGRGSRKADAEELGDLDGDGGGDCQAQGQDGVAPLLRRRRLAPRRNHELFPESLGIFDVELARQGIQIAQALDGVQVGLERRFGVGAELGDGHAHITGGKGHPHIDDRGRVHRL